MELRFERPSTARQYELWADILKRVSGDVFDVDEIAHFVSSDTESAFLLALVGDDWEWRHVDADGPNAPSHARASLASSPQVLIPLRDGSLALGTYQGVFFCEFDGPRERKIYVTTLA